MKERFFEVRYGKEGDLTVTVRPRRLKLLSSKAADHLRQANKEFLLAMREALDWCIERMEPQQTQRQERRRIEVQEG